jgi:flagellum-specific ATP synthase
MLSDTLARLQEVQPLRVIGSVKRVIGLAIECEGLSVPIGSLCQIHPAIANRHIEAEVVGFREDVTLLMPLGDTQGIKRGDRVRCVSRLQRVGVGPELLGRVVDARGIPIDGGPPLLPTVFNPIYRTSPHPLRRDLILEPLSVGIRSIDALHTCGKGQRVGLFSGSGVGKSLLMGMIARNTSADMSVICLVGERGREVREFIERDLGEEGLRRSVVVVTTSDQPALLRTKGPFTASAIAEYFRDQGKDVLLLMDSITRMANAQREIGLSIGEPPATKGYPPSVFAMMPRLLERAGKSQNGSITGIYTILVESDDINEPIADTARSILDGHVWLSRELAMRGHYPAVDPLTSISRLMIHVVDSEHVEAANRLKAAIAVYKQAEDLINIGAYVKGSNPEVDTAIRMMDQIQRFLRQGLYERYTMQETVKGLKEIAKELGHATGV